jgi:hypothetical protein
MVVTGGVGVLVVVAFVFGVALGRDRSPDPGDRLAVVAIEETPGFAVLAARCEDERVRAVEVRVSDGETLWRIESERGTIDRRYVVGQEPPPFGFETVTPLRSVRGGVLEAIVTVDDVTDSERFDPAALDDAAAVRAPCDSSDLDLVTLLFAIGALGVVAAYAAMVWRWWGGRG